jgi:hypothetical protein
MEKPDPLAHESKIVRSRWRPAHVSRRPPPQICKNAYSLGVRINVILPQWQMFTLR